MTHDEAVAILERAQQRYPAQTMVVSIDVARGCPVCQRVASVIVVTQIGQVLSWTCASCAEVTP